MFGSSWKNVFLQWIIKNLRVLWMDCYARKTTTLQDSDSETELSQWINKQEEQVSELSVELVGVVQNVHLHNWSWSEQRQRQNLFVDRSLSNTEICDFDTPSCVHDGVIDQEAQILHTSDWFISEINNSYWVNPVEKIYEFLQQFRLVKIFYVKTALNSLHQKVICVGPE